MDSGRNCLGNTFGDHIEMIWNPEIIDGAGGGGEILGGCGER